MSTKLFLFFIFIINGICFAFLDLEELKSFNYGIDIRSEPVVLKSEVRTSFLHIVYSYSRHSESLGVPGQSTEFVKTD